MGFFPTHRMCVRAVGAEGKGNGGVEDAKLADHLLHASDGALLVCVGELDHQAGGGALDGGRGQERVEVKGPFGTWSLSVSFYTHLN